MSSSRSFVRSTMSLNNQSCGISRHSGIASAPTQRMWRGSFLCCRAASCRGMGGLLIHTPRGTCMGMRVTPGGRVEPRVALRHTHKLTCLSERDHSLRVPIGELSRFTLEAILEMGIIIYLKFLLFVNHHQS